MLPAENSQNNLFAIQVVGDAYQDALLEDGGIIILAHSQTARNGKLIAVQLPGHENLMLKYYYEADQQLSLKSVNPAFPPLLLAGPEACEIKGKVVMVIRKPNLENGNPGKNEQLDE